MATQEQKRQNRAKELRELERRLKKRRHELKEAEKKLQICLKECLKKLDYPPWHYGPRCPHGGGGGG